MFRLLGAVLRAHSLQGLRAQSAFSELINALMDTDHRTVLFPLLIEDEAIVDALRRADGLLDDVHPSLVWIIAQADSR